MKFAAHLLRIGTRLDSLEHVRHIVERKTNITDHSKNVQSLFHGDTPCFSIPKTQPYDQKKSPAPHKAVQGSTWSRYS
jgi:hypothetical protein